VAWVNRAGAQPERLPAIPAAEIKSLADLPALLGL
jgi:2-haloacid dehalogenase